jgi:hypothetical protein
VNIGPLRISPFHVFDSTDSEQLECLLDIVLYFFWDALLLTCDPRALTTSERARTRSRTPWAMRSSGHRRASDTRRPSP